MQDLKAMILVSEDALEDSGEEAAERLRETLWQVSRRMGYQIGEIRVQLRDNVPPIPTGDGEYMDLYARGMVAVTARAAVSAIILPARL